MLGTQTVFAWLDQNLILFCCYGLKESISEVKVPDASPIESLIVGMVNDSTPPAKHNLLIVFWGKIYKTSQKRNN